MPWQLVRTKLFLLLVKTRPKGTGGKFYPAALEPRPGLEPCPDYGLTPQVAECCAWAPESPPQGGQLSEEPQSGEVSRQQRYGEGNTEVQGGSTSAQGRLDRLPRERDFCAGLWRLSRSFPGRKGKDFQNRQNTKT